MCGYPPLQAPTSMMVALGGTCIGARVYLVCVRSVGTHARTHTRTHASTHTRTHTFRTHTHGPHRQHHPQTKARAHGETVQSRLGKIEACGKRVTTIAQNFCCTAKKGTTLYTAMTLHRTPYTRTHTRTHAHTHAHTPARTHMHTHAHTRTHTHTRAHTHTHTEDRHTKRTRVG